MMKFLKANDGLGWQAKKYEDGRGAAMNLGNSSQQSLVSNSTSLIIDLFQVAIDFRNEAADLSDTALALGHEVVDGLGEAQEGANDAPVLSNETFNSMNVLDLPLTEPRPESITLIDLARLKRGTAQDSYSILKESQDVGYYLIDEEGNHKAIDAARQYDFVIMPDGQIRIGEGHGGLSGLTSVLYAGQIKFAQQEDKKIIINYWDNQSGKYKLSSMLACKVTVFPYDKFSAHIPSPPGSPIISGQLEEQFMRMSFNS